MYIYIYIYCIYSLIYLGQENDHALSEDGRDQAEALRGRLRDARERVASGDPPPAGAPGGPDETPWLRHLLRPDRVCSSPFTRALQTAALGLKDLLGDRELVILRELRESKSLGGVDCTGVAVGAEIAAHVEKEIREVYEASFDDDRVGRAVRDFREVRLDVSRVQDEWWGPLVGDSAADLEERILATTEVLRDTPGSLAGAPGVSVVVGHSLFIRDVFRQLLGEAEPGASAREVAASLKAHVIPLCGVVGARLEWGDSGCCRITRAVPLLGTVLRPSDQPQKLPPPPELGVGFPGGPAIEGNLRPKVAGCVCGRRRVECAIS